MIKEVSVIVLTYKNFEYLKENLESIVRQTYKDFEILISDDASPNFDENLIKEFFKNKKGINFKIIKNSQNIGTVKNFNNAIKAARGKYIIPLSADDIFYDEFVLENIIEKFKQNPEIDILTGIRSVYDKEIRNKSKELPLESERKKFNMKEVFFYNYLIQNGNIISGASTYYRKSIFDEIGYFNEDLLLLEDYPFYLNALRNSKKISFLDKNVIKYRLGGVSTSFFKNQKIKNDLKKMAEKELKNDYATFISRRVLKYYKSDKFYIYIDVYLLKFFYKVMRWVKNK